MLTSQVILLLFIEYYIIGESEELLKNTRIYVNHFAKDGLRTLCMAKKVRACWELSVP